MNVSEMYRPSVHLLRLSLRPEPIAEIQETYLTSTEVQIVATMLLVVAVAGGIGGLGRLQSTLGDRFGTRLAEASTMAGMASFVVLGVYAFSVIWHVTFVVEYTLESVAFDRFTVAQQLVTAAVIVMAYLAIRFVNRSIDTLAETDAITNHQSEVAYHVVDVAIVAFSGTVLLTLWGIDLTNIFIGAGAITAIVALTARETLTAMLAGFILLFSRPFRVGDWITVEDTSGVVTDVTIFTTKIQTFGDELVLVPNDVVTNSELTNFSHNDQLRVEVEVGVDYDVDVERARSVIAEAVTECESIKTTPSPRVIAKRFGDSAILLEVRVWIGDPTMRRRWDAQTEMIQTIQAAFEREGIDVPYPQRVHSARDDAEFRISEPTSEDTSIGTADD